MVSAALLYAVPGVEAVCKVLERPGLESKPNIPAPNRTHQPPGQLVQKIAKACRKQGPFVSNKIWVIAQDYVLQVT